MPKLIIPEIEYADVVNQISVIRNVTSENVPALNALIHAYVDLGQNKIIPDFSSLLSDNQKSDIVNKSIASSGYAMNFAYVYTIFEVMENLNLNGLISPNIALPQKYELMYEANYANAHANDPSFFDSFTTKFFGVVKSGIDDALKGLGFPSWLNFNTILIAVVVLIVIIIFVKVKQ